MFPRSITILNQEQQLYVGRMNSKGKDLAFMISAAKVISDSLSLPEEPISVIELDMYYNTTHGVCVSTTVDALNSLILIDIDALNLLTRNFYKLRVSYSQPFNSLLITNKDSAVLDFFNISRYISPIILQCICEKNYEIMEHFIKLKGILNVSQK
jgi:hypothetical protein